MRKKPDKAVKKQLAHIRRVGWVTILPQLIYQGIFGWFPILVAFIIAFQTFRIIGPSTFTGWDNFKIVFSDPLLPVVFKNTIYYTILSLALTFVVPIIVAILLLEMRKSMIRVMMLLWFIPISGMAGIIIWKMWYNVNYGLFNQILSALGLPTLRWLNEPHLVILCLVLPGLILFAPGLIYIASLQGIPQELYESAELEGCGFWGKIWYVTLPRMRPIIAMMLLLSVISKMQVFNEPMVMTGGGPGYASRSVVMQIYFRAFQSLKFGEGTALSVIFFFILMALIYIQRKYFKEDIDK